MNLLISGTLAKTLEGGGLTLWDLSQRRNPSCILTVTFSLAHFSCVTLQIEIP